MRFSACAIMAEQAVYQKGWRGEAFLDDEFALIDAPLIELRECSRVNDY